jgi:hypothetical protein
LIIKQRRAREGKRDSSAATTNPNLFNISESKTIAKIHKLSVTTNNKSNLNNIPESQSTSKPQKSKTEPTTESSSVPKNQIQNHRNTTHT